MPAEIIQVKNGEDLDGFHWKAECKECDEKSYFQFRINAQLGANQHNRLRHSVPHIKSARKR